MATPTGAAPFKAEPPGAVPVVADQTEASLARSAIVAEVPLAGWGAAWRGHVAAGLRARTTTSEDGCCLVVWFVPTSAVVAAG